MEFPATVISKAIEAKTTQDEEKLTNALAQLALEDPSFEYKNNLETGQLLVFGMGELHLDIITDRLEREFKVGINVGKPQVSYREGIFASGSASKTYEKDLGGKIHFGHCVLSVSPIDPEKAVTFESKVSKRILPVEFIEAIRKGIMDTVPAGCLAGYPFIGVHVILEDAKYEEMESSELAYTIAASMAFKEACQAAGVVLMEPLMSLEVIAPPEFTGEVIADLNGKRGRVLAVVPKKNKEQIDAEVPLAEMFGYSTDLRSKTQGRAIFTLSFRRYERMETKLAKQVLEKRGIFI
jgi:elongation factor G